MTAGAGQDKLFDAEDLAATFLEPTSTPIDGQARNTALKNLAKLHELRRIVEQLTREQVDIARDPGKNQWYSQAITWPEIGKALGVSKQAAAAKYGPAARADKTG